LFINNTTLNAQTKTDAAKNIFGNKDNQRRLLWVITKEIDQTNDASISQS